jgi:hypothetical protein
MSQIRRDYWPSRAGCSVHMLAGMLLRYFIVIARPIEEIETNLATGAQKWMPALAWMANGQGQRLLSELGFEVGKRRMARRIEVELGALRPMGGVTLLPIRWRAASHAGLFPGLDGQLEIAPIGKTTTQLSLSASYEPPFGLLGKIADRALMHRVAEITVKDFLDRIGDRLQVSVKIAANMVKEEKAMGAKGQARMLGR